MEAIAANILLEGLAVNALAQCETPVTLVTTDSREVCPGCIFVAFPGEKFDGHDFAAKALENGALCVVLNHPVEGVPEEKSVICPDSYHAMMVLGANYRSQFHPKVVGVTGSVGKTTTKQMTYAAIAGFGSTIKTEGNQNNELGLPRTMFRIGRDTEYAVVEMGMSHLHRCVSHRQSGQSGEHLQGEAGDLRRPCRGFAPRAQRRRPLPAQSRSAHPCPARVVQPRRRERRRLRPRCPAGG